MQDQAYQEIKAQDTGNWLGHNPPRIANLHPNNPDCPYVVAIGVWLDDAMQFVEDTYGVTIRKQQDELNNPDEQGSSVVYMQYVAPDAKGETVAYAMWALAEAGYDIPNMMEDYFMP